MRLLELDPRWMKDVDRTVGFVFRCPTKQDRWQTCFFEAGIKTFTCDACRTQDIWCCPHSQMGMAIATGIPEGERAHIQPCKRECDWQVHGELDFSTLTVTPSLDGSAAGNWHGHITDGEIVGGL